MNAAWNRLAQRGWFTPAVVVLVCWTLTTHGKYSVSGDEPHYLMVCQSLWADGDLDLRNNYEQNDGDKFGAAGLLPERHIRENRDGRFFPVHDVGMPIALLPVYVAATSVSRVTSEAILKRFRMTRGLFAYSLMSIAIIALVAAAASATRQAIMANGTDPAAASIITIVLWLSPPALSNSFVVFPEVFAMLATAAAVHLAFAEGKAAPRTRVIVLAGVLGVLPWFHRKFVFYGALLLVAALWERRAWLTKLTPGDRAVALALFVMPQLALALWTWRYWGNLAGPLALEGSLFSWGAFSRGAIGLLLDRESGLLVWAPIYALADAAWFLAGRRYIAWLLPTGALYLLSAAHLQWWAGFSPAVRFLLPLVPILAVIGAQAVTRRPFRYACLFLVLPQLFISADAWQHTRNLWPQGTGHNPILDRLLGAIGGSERLLPSLRTSPDVTAVVLWLVALAVANVAAAWASLNRDARFTYSS